MRVFLHLNEFDRHKPIGKPPGNYFEQGLNLADSAELKLTTYGNNPIPEMAARDALKDIRLVHKTLKNLNIPHAIIGGWAVVAWGAVRVTRDLDMLLLVDHATRQPLQKAFERLEYRLDWRKSGIDDPLPELLRLTPKQTGDRQEIDFLFASKGFDLDALNRAVTLPLEKTKIPVVCREDLIAMKLAAGGGLDIEDAKQLLRVHANKLDQELLENSCKRLKAHHALDRIQQSLI